MRRGFASGAHELSPHHPRTHVDLAIVLLFLGRVADAHAILTDGVKHAGDNAELHEELAEVLNVEGHAAEAMEQHLKAKLMAGASFETIDQLRGAYRDGGLKPPDAAAIATHVGAPAPVVDRIVRLLLRQKTLVKVDALIFHDEMLKQLKAEVAALKDSTGAGARIDVATFKDRFGVSRKFAIPLLEYLDRERVTRRVGESRVVL